MCIYMYLSLHGYVCVHMLTYVSTRVWLCACTCVRLWDFLQTDIAYWDFSNSPGLKHLVGPLWLAWSLTYA